MNIAQCIICKKPFQMVSSKVCPNCLQEMDEHFIKVRDFLDDNPHADVDKVSKETEVPKVIIMYLIKEGRLILGGGKGGGTMICEVCKKPIPEGKICDKCKANLASMIDKTAGSSTPESRKEEPNIKGSAKIGK